MQNESALDSPVTEPVPSWAEAEDDATWPGARRGTKILLAEDDADMRAVLSVILEADGHDVVRVADGNELHEALSLSDAAAEPCPFDLIITDVRMPGLSGTEVVERLRLRGLEAPVIVMTAFPSDQLRDKIAAEHALLVEKPFRTEALRLAIDVMLDLAPSR